MCQLDVAADGRPPALLELDRAACLRLLAGRPIGRLVFTHRALPEVLPVNYLLDGDELLIRLASGSVAAAAIRDAVVAFHVDDIQIDRRCGWTVTVVGRARARTTEGALADAAARGLVSWAGGGRDLLVAITIDRVTGRELLAVPPVQGRPARHPA